MSGNGRHRRPRQAPALFVTAGVTGAGLALPLLTAGGAQAADGATWDRVAKCESGGLWSANQDNGYYGGLQLSLDTWEEYGGTDYAERPDLASRGEQIAVAEQILSKEGLQGWPSCALDGGLTEDSAPSKDSDTGDLPIVGDIAGDRSPSAPETSEPSNLVPEPGASDTIDPAPTPSPSETGSDTSGDKGEGGDAEGDADTPAPSESPASKQSAPSDTGSPDTGSPDTSAPHSGAPDAGAGKHRGQPAQEEHQNDGRSGRGDHAGEAEEDGGGKSGEHRVRAGESLSGIAAEHGLSGGWHELYEQNRDTVGADPGLIRPGQLLHL
jgi:hypothetical protein